MADRLVALVVVALLVVAIALVGSSLSAVSPGERGTGEGTGPGLGDEPPAQQTETPVEVGGQSSGLLPEWLVTILLVLIVGVAFPVLLVARDDVFLGGVIAFVMLVVALLVLWLVPSSPIEQAGEVAFGNGSFAQGGGDAGTSAQADRPQSDRTGSLQLLYGVVGVAVVAAVGAVLYASKGVDDTVDLDDADPEEEPEQAAVGEAAGRAADTIEDADGRALSNAVYAAWHDMTGALDVDNPSTATPGEFADAAVDAGLDPENVAELTDVFEAVRYGSEPAAEYEDRAVAAFRAIESAHADDDGVAFDERRSLDAGTAAGGDGDGDAGARGTDEGPGGGDADGRADR